MCDKNMGEVAGQGVKTPVYGLVPMLDGAVGSTLLVGVAKKAPLEP